MVKITIKAKNLELTEALHDYAEKKIGLLSKPLKFDDNAEISVEMEKETNHHRKGNLFLVNCQVGLPGKTLSAQARSEDLYKAVVEAKDELKMEIEKYKVKKFEVSRREQKKFNQENL